MSLKLKLEKRFRIIIDVKIAEIVFKGSLFANLVRD